MVVVLVKRKMGWETMSLEREWRMGGTDISGTYWNEMIMNGNGLDVYVLCLCSMSTLVSGSNIDIGENMSGSGLFC
jgi:hypothetical protein